MKRYSKYLLISLLGAFLFTSCVDERLDNGSTEVVEGIPTEVTLSFATNNPTVIETKAAISVKNEYQISDLYIIVFNQNGIKEASGYFSTAQSDLNVSGGKYGVAEGTVKMTIASGTKTIFGIANIPTEGSFLNLSETIENVVNYSDLEEVMALIDDNKRTTERSTGKLVMTGFYKDSKDGENTFTIAPGKNNPGGKLFLERLDAKVKFTITKGGKTTEFKPLQYQIVNVPTKTYLVPSDEDATDKTVSSNDFFSTSFKNFETYDATADMSSFTFYMLENRNSASGITEYTERELQEKTDNSIVNPDKGNHVNNGEYLHGQTYATYVVITGQYKGTDRDDKNAFADVKYVVHLGYINEVNGSKANDFSAQRNHEYTYNITVNGVDNIHVEAVDWNEADGNMENEPGAEGNIIASDNHFLLDAHYEYRVVTISKQAILDNAARIAFYVKSPKNPGTYYASQQMIDETGLYFCTEWSDPTDIDWVKFVRDEAIGNNTGKYTQDSYIRFPGTTSADIKDAKQLVTELLTFDGPDSPYDEDGNAVYTMYVMEYYYGDLSWSAFVNQPKREMYILCNTEISQDMQSTHTDAHIAVSQRAIQSFYSSAASSGWGIETINETGALTAPGIELLTRRMQESDWNAVKGKNPWLQTPKATLSQDYGRYNIFQKVGTSGPWSTYITNEFDGSLNFLTGDGDNDEKRTKDLITACLQRNIDLNGDGEINDNEIRWYPAAINQYTDVWMGKDGIAQEAHLYQGQHEGYKRYLASDGFEFYAEEGSATSENNETAYAQYPFRWANSFGPNVPVPTKYEYRCIRDFGVELTAPANNAPYIDYVIHTPDSKTFILDLMNDNSIREDYVEAEIVLEDENHPVNRPYRSFIYSDYINSASVTWDVKNDDVTNGTYECASLNTNGETGWRMPNQRELALISSRVKSGWGTGDYYLWARTSSSLPKKIEDNIGYGAYAGAKEGGSHRLTIANKGLAGRVRCVKDIR